MFGKQSRYSSKKRCDSIRLHGEWFEARCMLACSFQEGTFEGYESPMLYGQISAPGFLRLGTFTAPASENDKLTLSFAFEGSASTLLKSQSVGEISDERFTHQFGAGETVSPVLYATSLDAVHLFGNDDVIHARKVGTANPY